MNVSKITVQNPISYGGNKNNKNIKRATAALTALLVTQPLASMPAQAESIPVQSIYSKALTSVNDSRIGKFSDLYYEVLNTNGQYNLKGQFYNGDGVNFAYYEYGGRTFDLDGNEIFITKAPNGTDMDSVKNSYYLTDLQKAYSKYGDKFNVEERYDKFIGLYYMYMGKAYNKDGWEIAKPAGYNQIVLTPPKQTPDITDFQKAYALFGNDYEIEEHYDENIGLYYIYAGKAYNTQGCEISRPSVYNQESKPFLTDFHRIYAQYGNDYEVVECYDRNIGLYYQYAGRTFDTNGREISIERSNSPININRPSEPAVKTDPRVKADSDFYYYYIQLGDAYDIKPYWDDNYGLCYQYGAFSFTQDGALIHDPENPYGNETRVR